MTLLLKEIVTSPTPVSVTVTKSGVYSKYSGAVRSEMTASISASKIATVHRIVCSFFISSAFFSRFNGAALISGFNCTSTGFCNFSSSARHLGQSLRCSLTKLTVSSDTISSTYSGRMSWTMLHSFFIIETLHSFLYLFSRPVIGNARPVFRFAEQCSDLFKA